MRDMEGSNYSNYSISLKDNSSKETTSISKKPRKFVSTNSNENWIYIKNKYIQGNLVQLFIQRTSEDALITRDGVSYIQEKGFGGYSRYNYQPHLYSAFPFSSTPKMENYFLGLVQIGIPYVRIFEVRELFAAYGQSNMFNEYNPYEVSIGGTFNMKTPSFNRVVRVENFASELPSKTIVKEFGSMKEIGNYIRELESSTNIRALMSGNYGLLSYKPYSEAEHLSKPVSLDSVLDSYSCNTCLEVPKKDYGDLYSIGIELGVRLEVRKYVIIPATETNNECYRLVTSIIDPYETFNRLSTCYVENVAFEEEPYREKPSNMVRRLFKNRNVD